MHWLNKLLRLLFGLHKEEFVMPYDRMMLRAELSRDEGRRNLAYEDSEGIMTIGVGWNLESNPMPEEVIDRLLDVGIEQSEAALDALYPRWKEELSHIRQRVLLNMAFNMGQSRLGGFVNMWAAIKSGDFTEASIQMLDSKWADQVGVRASRLAIMMERDEA